MSPLTIPISHTRPFAAVCRRCEVTFSGVSLEDAVASHDEHVSRVHGEAALTEELNARHREGLRHCNQMSLALEAAAHNPEHPAARRLIRAIMNLPISDSR
jgi:hypothetical protein